MRVLLTSAALLASSALAGCATAPAIPGPLAAYDRTDCAAAPNLASAVALKPEKPKVLHQVNTPVGMTTQCITWAGKATPYVVYVLPEGIDTKVFDVGATVEAMRIFAPEVTTLDANGAPVRTFARNRYQYRGALYSVQFEAKPEERYVMVTAAPELVGKPYSSIAIGTSTTTVYTGFGTASWTSGTDTQLSRTFSYDGMAQATVMDRAVLDAKKAKAS